VLLLGRYPCSITCATSGLRAKRVGEANSSHRRRELSGASNGPCGGPALRPESYFAAWRDANQCTVAPFAVDSAAYASVNFHCTSARVN